MGSGYLVASSLRWALMLLVATAVLGGALEIGAFGQAAGVGPLLVVDLYPVAGLVYVGTGAVAWWRRPSNRLGTIMVFAGLTILLVSLALGAFDDALSAVGLVLQTLPLAAVVHLILAFPSGRLRSSAARLTVAAGYVTCLVFQIPLYLFDPQGSPGGILAVAGRPGLLLAGTWAQRGIGIVTVSVACAILAGRFRRATRRQRRVLGPLYLYGMFTVLFIPLTPDLIAPLLRLSPTVAGRLQIILLMGVPVAFAAGLLLGGFARTGEIQELGSWLGAAAASRHSLTQALARALGDDSVTVAYWADERQMHVDAGGEQLELPGPGSGRAHVEIDLDGRRIGAILYDAVLIADPALVQAAGRVVAVAMDHDRLTAELLASRDELRRSRARLVEAADRERRRIARNLHDGLQMKLVLLGLKAQSLAGLPSASPAIADAATTLRSDIDSAAAELRQLVHAVMPAALIERGLGAAAQDLVDRLPLPTRLCLGVDDMIPEPVSSAAYFILAETLANAIKHARATKLAVDLAQHDHVLRVEVSDDGIGGVAAGVGLGLRSIADRVDVLGGRIHIRSPAGAGTQIVVELPCGS
jgi:signal transduction histidine kinase